MTLLRATRAGAPMALTLVVLACGAEDALAPTPVVPAEPCPSGRGPAMVRVPMTDGRSACIDTTEVTREQYAAFVADGGAHGAGTRLVSCGAAPYNDEPDANCILDGTVCKGDCARHPQVCITQCHAQAFCRWAGKKLCGTLPGAPPTAASLIDARLAVWPAACGSGSDSQGFSRLPFPYGDRFEAETCNTEGRPETGCRAAPATCGTTPVATLNRCRGPEPFAVFDMSGNVHEWIALTESEAARPRPLGYHLGGSFAASRFSPTGDYGCDTSRVQEPFGAALPTVGFRCCAD